MSILGVLRGFDSFTHQHPSSSVNHGGLHHLPQSRIFANLSTASQTDCDDKRQVEHIPKYYTSHIDCKPDFHPIFVSASSISRFTLVPLQWIQTLEKISSIPSRKNPLKLLPSKTRPSFRFRGILTANEQAEQFHSPACRSRIYRRGGRTFCGLTPLALYTFGIFSCNPFRR